MSLNSSFFRFFQKFISELEYLFTIILVNNFLSSNKACLYVNHLLQIFNWTFSECKENNFLGLAKSRKLPHWIIQIQHEKEENPSFFVNFLHERVALTTWVSPADIDGFHSLWWLHVEIFFCKSSSFLNINDTELSQLSKNLNTIFINIMKSLYVWCPWS